MANERNVRQLYEKFPSGDFTLEVQPRGRSETKVDSDKLYSVVKVNTLKTTRGITVMFDVSILTVSDHLK